MLTLTGTLKTPAGQPLANVEIRFYALITGSNTLKSTTGSVDTNGAGEYTVTLPIGRHRVTVRQGNMRPEAIGIVQVTQNTIATSLTELLMVEGGADFNPITDAILAAIVSANTAAATATEQAGIATAKASAASSSASAAKASASTATTKAGEASSSASAASQSQAAAATNESLSKEWADKAVDTAITGNAGKYSAKHHATKAAASASTASSSASTATTKAGEANSSATIAGQHKTSAESAAGIATTKAGEAVSSAAAAEQAKDATVNAIALSQPPEPDVLITFNDGLRIERGYGTQDKINVGGTDYPLPTCSVDFSRASGTTLINKSGELVAIPEDTPAISSSGLQIFGTLQNMMVDSEMLGSFGAFSHLAQMVRREGDKVSLTTRLTSQALLEAEGAEALNHYVRFAYMPPIDDYFTISGYVAPNAIASGLGRRLRISLFSFNSMGISIDLDTGETLSTIDPVTRYESYKRADGWIYFSVTAFSTNGVVGGPHFLFLDNTGASVYLGDPLVGYNFCGVTFSQTDHACPVIITNGTVVTRSPDVVSIPSMNNLPAPGRPFTIEMVAAVPIGDGTYSLLEHLNLGMRREDRNIVFATTNPFNIIYASGIDDKTHRFVFVFGATGKRIYVDGVLVSSNNQSYARWVLNGRIYLGSRANITAALQSGLSKFKIYHRALTEEQISALGGPQ